MKINGMEAIHGGLIGVGFTPPWRAVGYGDIFDDVWVTPDGKHYVERYIQVDVVEYDPEKHGRIWTNEEIDAHLLSKNLFLSKSTTGELFEKEYDDPISFEAIDLNDNEPERYDNIPDVWCDPDA